MKKIILLFYCLFIIVKAISQEESPACIPIALEAIQIEDGILTPPPFNGDNLLGGIYDTACINAPFYFSITIHILQDFGSAVDYLPLDSIELLEEGTLENLPEGLGYACNPPSCIITKEDTVGCYAIFGTPVNPDDVGQDTLLFNAIFHTIVPYNISFPQPEPFFPIVGYYILHVKPEGSENCDSTYFELPNTSSEQSVFSSLSINPNPFSSYTQINIYADLSGQYQLVVHDLFGRKLHHKNIRIFEGENIFEYDGSQLPDGMYIFSLGNSHQAVSRKMIVNKR